MIEKIVNLSVNMQNIFWTPSNYFLITIPPFIWNGFIGLHNSESIVANCISLPHDETKWLEENIMINILNMIGVFN